MVRVLVGALGALALALPAAAEVKPFPGKFRARRSRLTMVAMIHVRAGGQGAGGRADPRIRRHRRHVGALGCGARTGPYRGSARLARHGASPHIPRMAMTSARKRPTSGPSSPKRGSIGRPLSGTISVPWSPMPVPPASLVNMKGLRALGSPAPAPPSPARPPQPRTLQHRWSPRTLQHRWSRRHSEWMFVWTFARRASR